jgi:hypothetical protein
VDVVVGPGADLGAPPIRAGVSYDVVGEASSWAKNSSMRARQRAVGFAIFANEETPGVKPVEGGGGRSLVGLGEREVPGGIATAHNEREKKT